MSDLEQIDDFLNLTGVGDWSRERLPQDASSRHYLRLRDGSSTLIVMVSEHDASVEAFVKMSELLVRNGLSAPRVLAQNGGLLLLEDLGNMHAADHIELFPQDEEKIYVETVQAIARIQTISPTWDLPLLDAKNARTLAELFTEWCAPGLDQGALEFLEETWRALEPYPRVLSLRDLHAENIIWRPEKAGLDRIGLLDFQDSVLTHPLYDLVSLLRDARRDVKLSTIRAAKSEFLNTSHTNPDDFEKAFATISVQRALRILGIFKRLEIRDGKTKYRPFVPRIVAYLKEDLKNPHLSELAQYLEPEIKQYD